MKDFYCFNTEQKAVDCITAINNMPQFPLNIKNNCQKMLKWSNTPLVLKSGEYAVPRISTELLDYAKVPQVKRESFLSAYGQDIRQLQSTDFVKEV